MQALVSRSDVRSPAAIIFDASVAVSLVRSVTRQAPAREVALLEAGVSLADRAGYGDAEGWWRRIADA
jgi:hypothetical protein